MKKYFIILFSLLVSLYGFSQSTVPLKGDTVKVFKTGGESFLLVVGKGSFSDTVFIPTLDTSDNGARAASTRFVHSLIRGFSGGATIPPNIGSGFRLYAPQTPGFKSVFGNVTGNWDSTSNASGLTYKVDTNFIATRPRVQKGIDSLGALITTKGTVSSVATNNGTGINGGTITTTGTIAIDTTITIATRPRVQKGIDSLGAIKTNILNPIGNWINTIFPGTSLPSDWTAYSIVPTVNNGVTFGGNSGGITAGFIYNTTYGASQNYTQTIEFVLNTKPTDYPSGLFVGKRSANTSQQTQNAMWIHRSDASNWRITPTLLYNATPTQVADSTGTISMVNGDKYRIYAAYSNSNVYVRFARLNVSGQEIETAASVYKYTINAADLLQPANTGAMWIGGTGTTGNYTVTSANEYHYDLTNSEVLFVGNSIGVRYDASSVQNHYSFLAMNNSNKSWANFSGGGDRLIDMNLRVNEMISFNPRYVIIEAGTNDNASDIRSGLTQLIDTLQAHSIIPIFLKLFNVTAKDTVAYNVCREQGVQLVDCGRANISVPNNAAHPTDLGMQQIAYILKSECPLVTGSTGGHELYTFRGLGDVSLTLSPSNNDIPLYNSTTGKWTNGTLPTTLTVGTTPISSGTGGRLLFENSSNKLDETAAMSFDGTSTITFTGKLIQRQSASINNTWITGGNLSATGAGNVAVGPSGTAIGSGINNVAIGNGALVAATNADNNIAIGAGALSNAGSGFRNVAIGTGNSQNIVGGAANVSVGWSALQNNQSGLYNTAVGDQALNATTGTNNVAVGPLSGFNISSGGYNIILGSFLNVPSATTSGQLNIGNVIFGTGMYSTQTSSSTPTATGSIGIGLTTPTARLMLPDGTATASTAPLKFTTGTNLTVVENGAIEYDGTDYFASAGGTRQTLIKGKAGSFSQVGAATTTFTVTFGGTQPNSTYKVQVTPTAVLSAALFYVNNKTATTFDVVYLAGLTGTVTFDYLLIQ